MCMKNGTTRAALPQQPRRFTSVNANHTHKPSSFRPSTRGGLLLGSVKRVSRSGPAAPAPVNLPSSRPASQAVAVQPVAERTQIISKSAAPSMVAWGGKGMEKPKLEQEAPTLTDMMRVGESSWADEDDDVMDYENAEDLFAEEAAAKAAEVETAAKAAEEAAAMKAAEEAAAMKAAKEAAAMKAAEEAAAIKAVEEEAAAAKVAASTKVAAEQTARAKRQRRPRPVKAVNTKSPEAAATIELPLHRSAGCNCSNNEKPAGNRRAPAAGKGSQAKETGKGKGRGKGKSRGNGKGDGVKSEEARAEKPRQRKTNKTKVEKNVVSRPNVEHPTEQWIEVTKKGQGKGKSRDKRQGKSSKGKGEVNKASKA